mmetsp:Transcript_28394/g.71437  ORF Transcript_28394/g.71437 Transcript_28394/m.71437 type:complete len:229 (-) Transcript_28394:1322-2008(-)
MLHRHSLEQASGVLVHSHHREVGANLGPRVTHEARDVGGHELLVAGVVQARHLHELVAQPAHLPRELELLLDNGGGHVQRVEEVRHDRESRRHRAHLLQQVLVGHVGRPVPEDRVRLVGVGAAVDEAGHDGLEDGEDLAEDGPEGRHLDGRHLVLVAEGVVDGDRGALEVLEDGLERLLGPPDDLDRRGEAREGGAELDDVSVVGVGAILEDSLAAEGRALVVLHAGV